MEALVWGRPWTEHLNTHSHRKILKIAPGAGRTTHPPLFTGTTLNFAYYSEGTGSEELHNPCK